MVHIEILDVFGPNISSVRSPLPAPLAIVVVLSSMFADTSDTLG